jgi:hypothetical protein
MTGGAIALGFENGLSACGIAGEQGADVPARSGAPDHGANESDQIARLCLGEWTGRHRRVRNAIANDADDVLVAASGLERAFAEIDPGNLVSALAVTAPAIRFVQPGAGIDFRLRVAMLLREYRRSKR